VTSEEYVILFCCGPIGSAEVNLPMKIVAPERRTGVKKKSDRNRWVMHVPVLSTSHIKRETLNNLGPEFQVLSMEEGAFVWIGTEAYASAAYPKEWWVRFDRDGDIVPELPAFRW
jgi:hypothetical protein